MSIVPSPWPGAGNAPPLTTAFIFNLDTFDFVFMTHFPFEFTDRKSAVYQQVVPIGRSEPIMGYSHSGPRLFNIPVQLATRSGTKLPDNIVDIFTLDAGPFFDVVLPTRIMRSWVYPNYQGFLPAMPPRLLLVVGLLLGQRVIATDVDVKYMGPWERIPITTIDLPLIGDFPISVDTMFPYNAIVTLNLQEVMENGPNSPYDEIQVAAGLDLFPLTALFDFFGLSPFA